MVLSPLLPPPPPLLLLLLLLPACFFANSMTSNVAAEWMFSRASSRPHPALFSLSTSDVGKGRDAAGVRCDDDDDCDDVSTAVITSFIAPETSPRVYRPEMSSPR